MAQPVSGLNPTILKWARERSGYSIEQAAKLIAKSPQTVIQWEGGNSAPTYVQLEKLAYKIYRRPLALFFFPEPPEEPESAGRLRAWLAA
ncbi:MAG: helix-turn-helix transcriptional regulator, partial [Acidobacteriota bacterium]